jgi:hypothetical protein
MKTMKTGTAIALGVLLGACAAPKSGESKSPAAEAAQGSYQYPQQNTPSAYPQQSAPGTFAPPPPPPGLPDTARPASPAEPTPANRSVAMSQASNDVETSQRELDVAGGDCRNACRALGSMDRATGRICGLAQSEDEQRRCSDAKTRVYSARDKVRNTCGTCPDVSVERSAPIPSR